MPGIIKSVQSNQDPKFPALIENLVKRYISKPKCIILAVFTCKDDMENQAIFHMAREIDPTGSRTLGVLTKPDTIEQGTHERWVSILKGTVYSLKLGYFMVKLPSKKEMEELKITRDQSLATTNLFEIENQFFKSSNIWSSLKSRMDDRFGVVSLRLQLGSLLTDLIESSLPQMKQATEDALDEVLDITLVTNHVLDKSNLELNSSCSWSRWKN